VIASITGIGVTGQGVGMTRRKFAIGLCVLFLLVSTGGALADICNGDCGGGGAGGGSGGGATNPYANTVLTISNGGPGQTGRESQPGLSKGSGVFEGDPCFFNVHRSGPAGKSAAVDWRTKDGTATHEGDPGDYVRDSGTVHFEPHQRDATIVISTNFDAESEPDEHFFVILSNPRRAVIGDNKGRCTIFANSGD
jgi:hypothetical protein